MKIKEGASIAGLKISMRKALIEAEALWKEYGQELEIRTGLDGIHSAGSLHYYGYAVDLRTSYFDEAEKSGIAAALKSRLGEEFDVIIRKTHIHVELDAAKYL